MRTTIRTIIQLHQMTITTVSVIDPGHLDSGSVVLDRYLFLVNGCTTGSAHGDLLVWDRGCVRCGGVGEHEVVGSWAVSEAAAFLGRLWKPNGRQAECCACTKLTKGSQAAMYKSDTTEIGCVNKISIFLFQRIVLSADDIDILRLVVFAIQTVG